LWGRGRSATADAALAIEQAALAPLDDWLEPLEYVGLTQERRSLVMRALDLRWLWPTQTELVLDFGLASGQYATSLIRELGDFGEPR
jgi:tRNA pseudouridine13 synthase